MRTTLLGTIATLFSCAFALGTASAQAQDAAPAPATPPPPPEAAPAVPAPPPAAPAATPDTPPDRNAPPIAANEAAPPPAPATPPPAEETEPPAWFRIDSDLTGIQLWAGATHPLGEGIGLASDIYLLGTLGEFDLGPAFAVGPFTATPMLGYQVNWSERKSQAIVPQFYFTGGADPVYLEFWFQNYLNSAFTDGAPNDIYMRLFVDYKFSKYVGLGPEIEPWIALNKTVIDAETGAKRKTGISSFVVGGNLMLSNYGKNNNLFLFVGYETKKDARLGDDNKRGLGGRFTFVRNF